MCLPYSTGGTRDAVLCAYPTPQVAHVTLYEVKGAADEEAVHISRAPPPSLQPYCIAACNHMSSTLQPCVSQPATPCIQVRIFVKFSKQAAAMKALPAG